MQLNYFGSIRLIMGLLPSMQAATKAKLLTFRRLVVWLMRHALRLMSPVNRRWMRSRVVCQQRFISSTSTSPRFICLWCVHQ
jgi:hypothetical protein